MFGLVQWVGAEGGKLAPYFQNDDASWCGRDLTSENTSKLSALGIYQLSEFPFKLASGC